MNRLRSITASAVAVVCFAFGELAAAHCDSIDGPVVRDARAALEKRDPTAVLKWVTPAREQEIRDVFAEVLAVRSQGTEVRQLADRYFFETLVRVHRAGEGEGFTGLKSTGSVDPAIAIADRALDANSAATISRETGELIEAGIRRRFDVALERRKHAADSVEAGRAYVAAYVDYIHFVESAHHLGQRGASHEHADLNERNHRE
jgi:hypothetical protein